jgi:hypothetical protein
MKKLAAAGFVLVALSACGDGDSSSSSQSGAAVRTGTFVGQVSGTGACIAIVAGTQAVVAFVTDAANGISVPFSGPRAGDSTHLDAKNGDAIDTRIVRKRITGTITIGGVSQSFVLQAARGDAGLYRAAGKVGEEPVWAGWVVLNDGRQCGSGNIEAGVVAAPVLDTATQTFTLGETTSAVAKVEPDTPATDVEDPGSTFAGGAGLQGGISQFSGFTQFGFGQFSTQFSGFQTQFNGGGFQTQFNGGFQFGGLQGGFSFGGKGLGFGGGGFNPGSVPAWPAAGRRD